MEDNLENKARFFALYWGQKVNINSMLLDLNSIDYDGWLEDSFLELTPLPDITDEDAIGIIKILAVELHSESELEFVHNSIQNYIDKGYKGIDSHILDYLRSKGYGLPWMGLSVEKLIEYGWVKLKTLNK